MRTRTSEGEKQPRRAADETIFRAFPLSLGLVTVTRQAACDAVAASAAVIGAHRAATLTRPARTPRGLRIGGFLQLRWTLDRKAFWRGRNPFVSHFATFL
ncbi:hypothetical protein GCM10009734_56410 [Nonomuraea bangladeshensis]